MTSAEPPENGGQPDPFIGALLGGKYRVISELARGGMGKIYAAEQLPLGRPVALKVLRSRYSDEDAASKETFRKRFLLEASILSKVQHANIVTLYDYGRIEGTDADYFMAMELLRGETLAQRLRDKGTLSPLETIHLARQIARGLREAHKLEIVHRDLKPANIMLQPDDEGGEVIKILDFGIGKLVRSGAEGLTEEGLFLGSPKYMSPEQVHEESPVGAGSDIYALGVIMYECLVGSVPFTGESTMSLLKAHCEKPVPAMRDRNPDVFVPGPLEALVRQMLEKDVEKRPASASDVIGALKDIEVELTGDTRSIRSVSRPRPDGAGLRDSDPGTEGRGALTRSGLGTAGKKGSARKRTHWWIPVLVLTVVGAWVGTVTYRSKSEGEPTAPPAGASDGPSHSDEARSFLLAIESQPAGAEVLESDVVLGKTPMQLAIDRATVAEKPRTFTLRMPGYAPHTFSQPDSKTDLKVSASLVAEAPAPSPSASAPATETKPAPAPPKPLAPPPAAPTPTASNPDLQIKLKR